VEPATKPSHTTMKTPYIVQVEAAQHRCQTNEAQGLRAQRLMSVEVRRAVALILPRRIALRRRFRGLRRWGSCPHKYLRLECLAVSLGRRQMVAFWVFPTVVAGSHNVTPS
jgi:hypothetical protein